MKTRKINKRQRQRPRYKSHEIMFEYYCEVELDGTIKSLQDVADKFNTTLGNMENISGREQWVRRRKEVWEKAQLLKIENTIADKSFLDKELLNFWLDSYKLVRTRLTYMLQSQLQALAETNAEKRKKMMVSGYELEAFVKSFKEINAMIRLNVGQPTDYTKSDQTTRNITELLEDDLSRIDSYIKEIDGRTAKGNDKVSDNTTTNTGNN